MKTKEEIRTLVNGEMSDLICRVCDADLTNDDCEMLDHAADVITSVIYDAEARKEAESVKFKELSDAISVLKKLENEGVNVGEQLTLNGFECVKRIGTLKEYIEKSDAPIGVDSDFFPEIKQIISRQGTSCKKKTVFTSDRQIVQYGIQVYWNSDSTSVRHFDMVKDAAKYGGYIDFLQIPGICHAGIMPGEELFWNPSIINESCILGHIRTNLSYARIKDVLSLIEKNTSMICKINLVKILS